jgi:hypothetical protein
MSPEKNWPEKGLLRQVFICLRPPNPKPQTPSLHTVYVYTVYLITQEEGGGMGRTREKVTQQGPVSPVYNSNKHQPQSPFTGQYF